MQEVDILRNRIEKKETELHAWEEKLNERENVSLFLFISGISLELCGMIIHNLKIGILLIRQLLFDLAK